MKKNLLFIFFLAAVLLFTYKDAYAEGILYQQQVLSPFKQDAGQAPVGIPAPDVASQSQLYLMPGQVVIPAASPLSSVQHTEPEPQFRAPSQPLLLQPSQSAIPVPPQEELSPFEAYIRGDAAVEISRELGYFGYSFFDQAPSTFAPVENIPVSAEYVLGPGDELKVNIWGGLNGEYTLAVDREGMVNFPTIGLLSVAGLDFQEAKAFIEKEFSRYYKTSEVKLNVSMGKLRTISVFVVGRVKRPGSYIISALSTTINALFVSGGPSKAGSMRAIEIKRGGKTVSTLDLYDFLMKGDKSADVKLQPGDVIFVPASGKLVGIAGNVNQPAIYELKAETRLKDLIDMAGGVTATGYVNRIQVERIHENRSRLVMDLDLNAIDDNDNIVLNNGDLVKVFPISNIVYNNIELKGNVVWPGTYEWRSGMRLRDLIRGAADLLPDTYLESAIIERMVPPDNHKEYVSVDLGKSVIEGIGEANIELRPRDVITVLNRMHVEESRFVSITGAVNKPGKFEFRPNMRVSDLLTLAGGAKNFAYLEYAELTSILPSPEGPKTERITIDLRKAVAREKSHDLEIRENDHLYVRPVPEWETYRNITITGEVRFPGTYMVHKGERLSSLIDRAGGFTERAYLNGAVFTRESVRRLQQKQLDEAIDRLEQELITSSSVSIETALTQEDAAQQRMSAAQKKNLISKLRAAKAKGRVTLNLASIEKLRGSENDIPLENEDSFFVPERPNEVHVIGAVYNQTAFLYNQKANVSKYLKLAGGATKSADTGSMYVLKVNGTAVSKQASGFMLGSFNSMRLDPGDTVVVPEDLEHVNWLKEAKDITQILYQIAVTAGVLIVAF